MPKEIAIIIPVYKAHSTIRRALSSLDFQDIKNQCEVVLINDCDGSSYHYLIKEYPELKITILKTSSNSGPAMARNKGLEYVLKHDFKYLMFLDADDAFYSHHSIAALYNYALTDDLICSRFLIEHEQNNCEWREDRDVWLFGKIYNIEVIHKNNIHFPPISQNEDVAFNMWYWICCNSYKIINDITYIWKYTPNSITRHDNCNYNAFHQNGLYKNLEYVFERIQPQYEEGAATHLLTKIIKFYLNYCENSDAVSIDQLSILYKYYILYKAYYTDTLIKDIYNLILSESSPIFPIISFSDFMRLLENAYNNLRK